MIFLNSDQLEQLANLRKHLHQHPELSHREKETPGRLMEFLKENNPNLSFQTGIGGNGFIAVADSGHEGPVSVFRAELDALPIQEINKIQHKSQHEGIGHKCGHDGHMAILCGLGIWLASRPPERGKVVLLFQPAEEVGEGAEKMIDDPAFKHIEGDRFFALHNLPGYEKGEVLLKDGVFASASAGMEVFLKGRTSHAGHPENGVSPVGALAYLLNELPAVASQRVPFGEAALITVIHSKLGEIAFGTSPGYGEIRATLRTHTNEALEVLQSAALSRVEHIAVAYGLNSETQFREVFSATINDGGVYEEIRELWESSGFPVRSAEKPFPWSEDFGRFLEKKPGLFFGLGAGESCPQLHNPDYDFPDDLIGEGVKVFAHIASHYHH